MVMTQRDGRVSSCLPFLPGKGKGAELEELSHLEGNEVANSQTQTLFIGWPLICQTSAEYFPSCTTLGELQDEKDLRLSLKIY